MKKIAFIVAAAAAFGTAPLAARLGPVLGAVFLVALAVLLAIAASGTVNALTVASGAFGAFAAGVLTSVSVALAGAVLLSLCFAERTIRVRGAGPRLLHIGTGLLAGAAAGALTGHYVAADLSVRAVVVVLAAVVAALPLLVEADDPLAHALEQLGSQLKEPAKSSLEEGAELRRTVDASLLERSAARHVGRTWSNLLRLGHARLRLDRPNMPAAARARRKSVHADAVAERIDQRIADHVVALTRAYTAADAASAAEMSLEDQDLRSVETHGESLEQMSKAVLEEV